MNIKAWFVAACLPKAVVRKRETVIPAVIVGDTPINGLGVARNLGREGINVHRIGTRPQKLLNSRYISVNEVVPKMDEFAGDTYVRSLTDFADRVGEKSVLFPLGDIHVLKISKHYQDLKDRFFLTASDYQSTETLVNKRRFYRSLQSAAVPHPHTRFPSEIDEFVSAAEQVGYPVMIKPAISPLFGKIRKGKGFIAHNGAQLRRSLPIIESSGLQYILQEIIPGSATSLYGCAGFKEGDKIYSFCYQRIREYPLGFGVGSMLISIPSFISETKLTDYLKEVNYNGIFEAEFKLDPRDGSLKLIEINARSWWQSILPTKCGLNFIKAAYDHAIGTEISEKTMLNGYRTGIKWINLSQDYKAARQSGINLLKWLLSLRGEKVYAIWSSDDVYPIIWSFLGVLPNILRNSLKHREREE